MGQGRGKEHVGGRQQDMRQGATADERRRDVLKRAFEGLATDLLLDQPVAAENVDLLAVVLVDAALAGDRELLFGFDVVVSRLRRYESRTAESEGELEAQLDLLEFISSAAAFLLEREMQAGRVLA